MLLSDRSGLLSGRSFRQRDAFLILLLSCCLLAFLIRLIAYALMPGPLIADESFQYLEQAHRLVYGTGLVPWEYVLGVRSWLLPGLLSPAFALGRLFDAGPNLALWLIAIALSLLSLPTVACAALWGRRGGGLAASAASGSAVACWFEIAAFAPHALADTVATSLLVPGLYLSSVGRALPQPRWRLAGGLLLGGALVIRLQLAPVIVAASCWCAWRGGLRQVLIGLAVPVLLLGAVDWITWSYPFQSVIRYFWVNLALGGADSYGVQAWYAYFGFKLVFWGALALPIVFMTVAGATRLPGVALCTATVALPFFILSHKEDRFLYPALPLLFTLAGTGSAMLVDAVANRIGWQRRRWLGGLVLWPVISLVGVQNAPIWRYLYQYRAINSAVAAVNRAPDTCGIAMHPQEPWARTPGYASFSSHLKVFGFTDGDPIGRTGAFNYVIDSSGGSVLAEAGFSVARCWDEPTQPDWPDRWIAHACLWHRKGGCDAAAAQPLRPPMPVFLGRARRDKDGKL